MKEYNYQVTERIATISTNGKYSKQVNRISYNGNAPKVDIRTWKAGEDGTFEMCKGISLTDEETRQLRYVLNNIGLAE